MMLFGGLADQILLQQEKEEDVRVQNEQRLGEKPANKEIKRLSYAKIMQAMVNKHSWIVSKIKESKEKFIDSMKYMFAEDIIKLLNYEEKNNERKEKEPKVAWKPKKPHNSYRMSGVKKIKKATPEANASKVTILP